MQTLHTIVRTGIRRWLSWAVAGVVLLCIFSPALRSESQPVAERKGPASTSYDQISPVLLGQETFEKMMAQDKAEKAAVMARQKKLLEERYDLSARVTDQVTMSRGKPIPVGPATRLPKGTTWEQLARDVARRDPREGPVPQGIPAAAAPQARGGRHGLPADGDQTAAAPRTLRPRFRPSRALPARVPAGHLPDHASGPGRRVPGQGSDRGQLPGALPGHPQCQGPGGPAPAGHAVPAAAIQRHGRPQDGAGPTACRAWPASTATSTATRRRRPTWWATSGRSRTAAASTRRACAASTSSGCSARSGRSRPSRTSPSSSSGRRTSTATRCRRRPRAINPLERGSQVHFMAEVQESARLPAGARPGRRRQARPQEIRGRIRLRCEARSCSSARHSAPPATRPRTTPTT